MRKSSLPFASVGITVLFLSTLALRAAAQAPAAQPDRLVAPFSSREEAEKFLRTAKIVKAVGVSRGITGPLKMTLSDGGIQHDAANKDVDEHKRGITELASGPEYDFKDSWMYEIAAYEIDKLLGLSSIPPTVERSYEGRRGSLQLWVENCMMESDRLKKKIDPPDKNDWAFQMTRMRAFDQLVYNIDRNLGNLLITPEWRCILIDHSRCFKSVDSLKNPKDLTTFSRRQIDAFARLNKVDLKERCGKYLIDPEITALLKRRDLIAGLYQRLIKEKGESAIYP